MVKHKKNNRNGLTKTKKTGILKGVGSYAKKKNHPRTTNRVRGRGGFFEDAGSAAGSWLGKKAGGFLSSIFGMGSYSVTKNSLVAQASDPPILSNTRGATRVQHREYIQDITGSTAFSIQSFPINPGLSSTFPWLASVASCFEEYILHGILFEFKSTSASALNSTNTALGTVIMATEYNALHANFVGKRDMENYVYSTSISPDTSALHPVECARDVNVLNELYVRNSPPVLVSDLRFSDLGRFQIATIGMQAAANIGELWVTYDVELIKPKLPDNINSIAISHFKWDSVTEAAKPITAANLFGTDGTALVSRGIGLSSITFGASNVMTFTAAGRFLVLSTIMSSNSTVTPHTATAGTGVNIPSILETGNGNFGQFLGAPNGATASQSRSILYFFADVSADQTLSPTVTFASYATTGTIYGLDIWAIPVPQGFNLEEEKSESGQIEDLNRKVAMLINWMSEPELEYKEAVIQPLVSHRSSESNRTGFFHKMNLST